uniref:Protein SEC13 homolog n=1 Tax=Maconellicoccus hirsutus TaxID=177089 RepID=A2I487_MACHI|nr:putative SEC13-like protein 1 [Maconellicoccus hirsutus]
MVSILNTVETGHEDVIHDAEMDYYGLRLATCSSDQSIKIYNLKNGTQSLVADLKGHYGPVWQVAWAHPKFGNFLASCSYDRKVIIWKETNNEWVKFHEYTNHDSSVNSVAWAPHEYGLILACGSLDGTISIISYTPENNSWEPKRIMNAHTSGCNAVSWCPASALISSLNPSATKSQNKRLASGGCDNLVKIWKEEGDQWVEETKIEIHSDWVRDVAWAPSVGLTKNMIASCSQDHRVFVSSSDDFINWKSDLLHKFDDAVWSVSWSLTANILAVSGADNKVSLWKIDTEGQWVCISEVIKGKAEISN